MPGCPRRGGLAAGHQDVDTDGSEAVALAGKLRSEGRSVVRRWKFLVIGASNEDDAHELADQVRREASADATVRAGRSAVYLPFAGF